MVQTIDSKEKAVGLFLARDTRDYTFLVSFTVDNHGVGTKASFSPYHAIVFDAEHLEAFFAFMRLSGNDSFEAFAVSNLFPEVIGDE